MAVLSGQCLCGAIRVRCEQPPGAMLLCHCKQCRKSAGAPFLSVFPLAANRFLLDDPQQQLRQFRASPHKLRAFCGRCGAPIYSRRDGADTVRVRAGLFEHLDGIKPVGHIFMAEAATWYRDADGLPRYAALEPGRAPLPTTFKEPAR